MTHLEIEYKTLLNKDEFNRLKTHFSQIAPVRQTNYYFDTDNFIMKAKRMSLRIRTFSDHAELTLKLPQKVGTMEYNHDLTLPEAKEIIKTSRFPEVSITQMIREHGIEPSQLKSLGNLTTVRQEMKTNIGLMALDSNQYASIKDYELELEVSDPEQGKQDFEQFLKEHHISFKYAKSKVARFSSTLNPKRK